MSQSIFSEEWRDCLVAHYTYVVRMGDQGTERTLRGVMVEAGFSEDELRQLYLLATAHVDDVGADFVPDAELLAPLVEAPPAVEPDELDRMDKMEVEAEEAVEEEVVEEETGAEEADQVEPPPDPGITQLSLF